MLHRSLLLAAAAAAVHVHHGRWVDLGTDAAGKQVKMPGLLLGTGYMPPYNNDNYSYPNVKEWLALGGRGIDTALSYGDQAGIGQAWKDSGVAREDIFFLTKIGGMKSYDETIHDVNTNLGLLQLEAIDMIMPHWCAGTGQVCDAKHICDQWAALEALKKEGKVRSIAVSNYCTDEMDTLLACPNRTEMPVLNNIELHPSFNESVMANYAKEKNIGIQSYSPLATGSSGFCAEGSSLLTENTEVKQIAAKYSVTTGQVVLQWHLQNGYSATPRICPHNCNGATGHGEAHMKEAIALLAGDGKGGALFTMTDDEMAYLNTMKDSAKCWPWSGTCSEQPAPSVPAPAGAWRTHHAITGVVNSHHANDTTLDVWFTDKTGKTLSGKIVDSSETPFPFGTTVPGANQAVHLTTADCGPFVTLPAGDAVAADQLVNKTICAARRNSENIIFLIGSAAAGAAHAPDYKVVTFTDAQKEAPPAGQCKIHVAHLSPDAPAVDVAVDGAAVWRGVAYGDVTANASHAAGVVSIAVTAGGATALHDESFNCTAGANSLVVVQGAAASLELAVLPVVPYTPAPPPGVYCSCKKGIVSENFTIYDDGRTFDYGSNVSLVGLTTVCPNQTYVFRTDTAMLDIAEDIADPDNCLRKHQDSGSGTLVYSYDPAQKAIVSVIRGMPFAKGTDVWTGPVGTECPGHGGTDDCPPDPQQ